MMVILIPLTCGLFLLFTGVYCYGRSLYLEEGRRRLQETKKYMTYEGARQDAERFWEYWKRGGGRYELVPVTPMRLVYRKFFR